MKVVTLVQAKAKFSRLLREAQRGEEIVILREGRPVARLVSTARAEELRAEREQLSMSLSE